MAEWRSQPLEVLNYLFLAHLPFIILGNVLVILTVWYVRRLHTAANFLLASLASVDLMSALYIVPILLLTSHPDTVEEFLGSKELCVVRWSVWIWTGASLWIFIVIQLDRFVAINFPYYYSDNVTGKGIFIASSAAVLIEVTLVVALAILLPYDDDGISDLEQRCRLYDAPGWHSVFTSTFKGVQVVVGATLNLQVLWAALASVRRGSHLGRLTNPEDNVQVMKQILKIKVQTVLTFFFMLTWLPTLLAPAVLRMFEDDDATGMLTYRAVADHARLLNSSVNPVVCGYIHGMYRDAYSFFMTHSVRDWNAVNVYINEKLSVTSTHTKTSPSSHLIRSRTTASPAISPATSEALLSSRHSSPSSRVRSAGTSIDVDL